MNNDFESIIAKLEEVKTTLSESELEEMSNQSPTEILERYLNKDEVELVTEKLGDFTGKNSAEAVTEDEPMLDGWTKNRESSDCRNRKVPTWDCTGSFGLFTIPCDHYDETMEPSVVVAGGYMQYRCTCSRGYYPPFVTVRVNPDVP